MRRDQLERDFYVIVSGQAAVHIDGDHIRDLVPGDFFGELAALDWGAGFGYARSATVTATHAAPPARPAAARAARADAHGTGGRARGPGRRARTPAANLKGLAL